MQRLCEKSQCQIFDAIKRKVFDKGKKTNFKTSRSRDYKNELHGILPLGHEDI